MEIRQKKSTVKTLEAFTLSNLQNWSTSKQNASGTYAEQLAQFHTPFIKELNNLHFSLISCQFLAIKHWHEHWIQHVNTNMKK